jgi:tRNA-2-methylthio-N6-dimethylallyladenosine synthase
MMNYSDTERVASVLENIGYSKAQNDNEADLYIFNTCSIRQKGEDRVLGTLKKLTRWKLQNPRLLIGLTGCMIRKTGTRNSPKEEKDDLLRRPIKGIDFVFIIKDTHRLAEILAEAEPNLEQLAPELHFSAPGAGPGDEQNYLQITPKYTSPITAYVPIQVGCDQYCTYCIVPYARGREQSRPLADIYKECEQLVKNGCKEITLGGQIVNSYGQSDLDKQTPEFQKLAATSSAADCLASIPDPFVYLLTKIDSLHSLGLNRLRFTSPHPRYFSDALIEAHAKLKTLCPHIHLPIQAGDDDMLKRMNRRYTVDDYRQIIKKIKQAVPGCALSTDIIVGFSGETEDQFNNTLKIYNELRWDMAYIARYSERKGTVASNAFPDDVSREAKAERWHKLNKILEECSQEKNTALIGKNLEVLVEKYLEETGECEGRSRENKVVQFPGTPELLGKIMPVKIRKALRWVLKGAAL